MDVLIGQFTDGFSGRVQLVAVIVTAIMLGVVIELVRRRRLVERYALLWIVAGVSLLVLALWRGLLDTISEAMGVNFPPNALFLLAFGVVFLLLLHFSVATSRLGEETKILAQEVARLDQEVRALRGETPTANGNGAGPDSAAEKAEHASNDPPIGGEGGAENPGSTRPPEKL